MCAAIVGSFVAQAVVLRSCWDLMVEATRIPYRIPHHHAIGHNVGRHPVRYGTTLNSHSHNTNSPLPIDLQYRNGITITPQLIVVDGDEAL